MESTPAKPPRRRRKWIVAGAVLLVAVGVLVFSSGGGGTRQVTFGFAGITNHHTLPHVWLWVTNGSRPAIFRLGTVSYRLGDAWVLEGYPAVFFHTAVQQRGQRGDFYAPHQVCLVSMQVHMARLPLRVGLDVVEQPAGVTAALKRLKAAYMVHLRGQSNYLSYPRMYSVTNEFWPGK